MSQNLHQILWVDKQLATENQVAINLFLSSKMEDCKAEEKKPRKIKQKKVIAQKTITKCYKFSFILCKSDKFQLRKFSFVNLMKKESANKKKLVEIKPNCQSNIASLVSKSAKLRIKDRTWRRKEWRYKEIGRPNQKNIISTFALAVAIVFPFCSFHFAFCTLHFALCILSYYHLHHVFVFNFSLLFFHLSAK